MSDLGITKYLKTNSIKIWEDMVVCGPCWQKLSDIAIKLLSAQGSETICQRKISMKRLAINNRRLSTKEDLVEAQFRLSCNKPPENGKVISLNDLAYKKLRHQKTKSKELVQTLISTFKT